MKWYITVGFTVLVMASTLLIRIPVPGGGYFNFGDVVIVFSGLYGGKRSGMVAGAIGSAMADIIGFPLFAPITLVAKGSLGFFAGLGKDSSGRMRFIWPIMGGILMVLIYFVGTWFMPSFGKAAALADLPPNLVQALFGFIGGRLLYKAYVKIEGLSGH
ncbi:MAG: ECF transporter S component [Candidatus Cloacimonetes bacterium]|nr:ECF transporter S component [Candidatus Cloacimonadota bacterium]